VYQIFIWCGFAVILDILYHAFTEWNCLCRDLQAEQSANENTPQAVGIAAYFAATVFTALDIFALHCCLMQLLILYALNIYFYCNTFHIMYIF